MSKAVVKSVDPCSIAEDCGIEKGDIITKVNNKEFADVLDFRYLTSDEYYVVEVEKSDGTTEEIEVYNDLYEQFGCEFENSLMDEPKDIIDTRNLITITVFDNQSLVFSNSNIFKFGCIISIYN